MSRQIDTMRCFSVRAIAMQTGKVSMMKNVTARAAKATDGPASGQLRINRYTTPLEHIASAMTDTLNDIRSQLGLFLAYQ